MISCLGDPSCQPVSMCGRSGAIQPSSCGFQSSIKTKPAVLLIALYPCCYGGSMYASTPGRLPEWPNTYTHACSLHADPRHAATLLYAQLGICITYPSAHCVQVIDLKSNMLQNVITFPPEGAFIVDSSINVAGLQRVDFQFNAAGLKLPEGRRLPFPPFGQGW